MLANKALSAAPSAVPVYVEDVFSTYLYTGSGATKTITNDIDLSGKGGMVWFKSRSNAYDHNLVDTERGNTKYIFSNLTNGNFTSTDSLTAFNNNGFTLGADSGSGGLNTNTYTYASWTFAQQEKFFDVVTYTGNGSNRTIAHNLGSVPGCIIIKATSEASQWAVYHRSQSANPQSDYLLLNSTAAVATNTAVWNNTQPTSTHFSLGTNSAVNTNTITYVAYLFAHDAGGFGASGSDNVISCASFTTNGSGGATVTLGYEPQWILMKNTAGSENWVLVDNMRGIPYGASTQFLKPNLSDAEGSLGTGIVQPTATGFTITNSGVFASSNAYIYIAIRRGPMKTPTSGTSVFTPVIGTSSQSSPEYLAFNAGFPIDLSIIKDKANVGDNYAGTRLTGRQRSLIPNATSIETTDTINTYDNQRGLGFTQSYDVSGWISWMFRRAPGFFDVVCYKGTGSAGATTNHNLGVSPELVITRVRDFTGEDWIVTYRDGSSFNAGYLNSTAAFDGVGVGTSTDLSSFTSTTYVRNTSNRRVNSSSYNYVAYLFASLSGVSKVGSYTGNGSSVTVTTDFQPRFILVKRTDSTGDWIVSDSARGLVAGNDPYLRLNSTAVEVTNEDWVDISSTSFTVNQTANNANVNTGTYIYLAIA